MGTGPSKYDEEMNFIPLQFRKGQPEFNLDTTPAPGSNDFVAGVYAEASSMEHTVKRLHLRPWYTYDLKDSYNEVTFFRDGAVAHTNLDMTQDANNYGNGQTHHHNLSEQPPRYLQPFLRPYPNSDKHIRFVDVRVSNKKRRAPGAPNGINNLSIQKAFNFFYVKILHINLV